MRGRIITVVCLVSVLAAVCGSSSGGARRRRPSAFPNVVDLRSKATGAYPEVDVEVEGQRLRPRRDPHQPGHDRAVGRTRAAARTTSCPPTRARTSASTFGVGASKFEPGAEYEFRFDTPGVYRYYCSLHGSKTKGMIGEVVVGDVDAERRDAAAAAEARQQAARCASRSDYPTIQEAVDAAKPGSLVLVSPGVYKEAVTVTTPNIVIRGLDRTRHRARRRVRARQRHQGARRRRRGREHDRARLQAQRLLLDRRQGLPRLVPHRDPQRRLRHLRVRLDVRPVRPRLRTHAERIRQ